MAYLVLIRHGESEWNVKGWWTGLNDVNLTEKGKEEARLAGEEIKDIPLSIAYTSPLTRAKETWKIIQQITHQEKIPTIEDKALNERDYGDLAGQNKWDIQKKYGDEQFLKWRRGWDTPPPNGESLKDVYVRAVPYYESEIKPHIEKNENVIIVAHGNTLRALVKYLESIDNEAVTGLEIATGEIYVYTLDTNGTVLSKELRSHRENKA